MTRRRRHHPITAGSDRAAPSSVIPSAAKDQVPRRRTCQHFARRQPAERCFFVSIMANEARTFYAGVTNDLARRILEHRRGDGPTFAAQYGLDKLV
jgi:hypothetical protein